MEYEVEIDVEQALEYAETMLESLDLEIVDSVDMMASVAIIIASLSEHTGIDSMMIVHNIESIVNEMEKG